MFRLLLLLILLPQPTGSRHLQDAEGGIMFKFKGQAFTLQQRLSKGQQIYYPRDGYDDDKLDTLSNWFSPSRAYIEIIRQDDAARPTIGLALGFEFDENNGEYPYTPARAILQLKDFGWGGVEFSRRDTMNYTGVSNDVSEDIQIEVDGFSNDTIWGRFSGVLVSGSGVMSGLEDGRFMARVYRVK